MCGSGIWCIQKDYLLYFRSFFVLSSIAVLFPMQLSAESTSVSSRVTYYITRDYQEVWEGGKKVETIKHYRFNDQKVATRDGDGLKFHISDHLGSAAKVSDEEGDEIKAYWYTPYGSDAKEVGAATVRHKYNDKEHDDTGWYYYIARYQDPEVGRFVSADSILPNAYDLQLLNRFAYVKNNPIRLVDPSGHNAVVSGVLQGLKFALSFAGFDLGASISGTVVGDALVHYLDPPYLIPNPVGDYFLQFSNGGEKESVTGQSNSDSSSKMPQSSNPYDKNYKAEQYILSLNQSTPEDVNRNLRELFRAAMRIFNRLRPHKNHKPPHTFADVAGVPLHNLEVHVDTVFYLTRAINALIGTRRVSSAPFSWQSSFDNLKSEIDSLQYHNKQNKLEELFTHGKADELYSPTFINILNEARTAIERFNDAYDENLKVLRNVKK